MEVKFTPEHKVINDLFAREVKYIIPEYQRPYSWDCLGKSDKNNQVNAMWDDLYSYFQEGKRDTYFFGSMVLIGNGNRVYRVIDGQQRLTTTVLLFAAFKCFILKVKKTLIETQLQEFADAVINDVDDLIFDKRRFGVTTLEKKVKIEKSGNFDFDEILHQAIECGSFKKEDFKGVKPDQVLVAERYFKNKDYFVEKLQDCFLTNGEFTLENAEKLNKFIDFVKNHVSVVRILTDSFEIAYHIFEILNNRGLPLSNKDLFRNFVIREFDALKNEGKPYATIDPTEKWTELESNFEIRDDFLGRWVESINARQQQFSAFNDLKEIYEKQYQDQFQKKKIELLYADIARDLGYFSTVINADVKDPFLKAKLKVVLNAGNSRYTLNFLLALWRKFQGNETEVFPLVNAYEIFLLHKSLVGRFVYGPVYSAIAEIKEGKWAKAIETLAPEQDKDRLAMELMLENLDNESGKLLISKWVWLNEAKTEDDDLVRQELFFDRASLEHILPQNPEKTSNWTKDFSDSFKKEYTYRLGNMTLLTGRQNAAARNFDFQKKKLIYTKTKLPAMQELVNLNNIDEQFIIDRHERIVLDILKDLGIENWL